MLFRSGLKLIEIVGWVSLRSIINLNAKSSTGPLDFLELFRDAEFVFTSSFHGTAFSIIFEKQFIVYMNKNEERVLSILRKLNLINRFTNQFTGKNIAYRLINKDIKVLIDQSKTYITANVSQN